MNTMKSKYLIALALVAGFFAGWSFGYNQAMSTAKATEVVNAELLLQSAESHDLAEAVRNVRAIGLIDSGETQQAIQMLCTPIAQYYHLYTILAGTDDRRSEARALIEELAQTNAIVAERIFNE